MNQNRWPHAASALAISYSDKKQGNAAATLSRNHGVIRHRWRITPYLVRATSIPVVTKLLPVLLGVHVYVHVYLLVAS